MWVNTGLTQTLQQLFAQQDRPSIGLAGAGVLLQGGKDPAPCIQNRSIDLGATLEAGKGHIRLAAIMRTKRSSGLMRLRHPLALRQVAVEFAINTKSSCITFTLQWETHGKTGVEMEALTAVQVGLLTIDDMCKAVDRGMTITDVRLLEKQGREVGELETRYAHSDR